MSKIEEKNEEVQEPKEINPKISKTRLSAITVLSVSFLLFQLYIGMYKPLPSIVSTPVHLCLALSITFLYKPMAQITGKKWTWLYDLFLLAGTAVTAIYFITNLERLQYRVMMVDPMLSIDLLCSVWMLVIIMEAVRRTIGMNLFIFISIFIVYAFLGQKLTGPLRYSGMNWKQFAEMLTLSTDGIMGTPLITSVNSLFYFLLFGAFFSKCGGGQVLIDLGMKLSDKTAGGPAKASVVSSGLMGMISGSAVANVTTTGVMTIPLMKKAGYTREQAGAIEAIASTGGQIMPPIMGVGAFIMAEMIGVSYAKIATAAIIPALAYYGSIFLLVHFLAKKSKLENRGKEQVKYTSAPILPRLYQLVPIFVVVGMIFKGFSLTRSALFGTTLAIVVSMFSVETRMNGRRFMEALLDGIRQAGQIAIPTSACGIMIGIVVRSGVANKLTKIITIIGGSNIVIALGIAMLGCMLLGMALPTVAAYLISNILFCPTIIALGIPALPANMFIFYFGVIAQITPPVCLASFTAAGIAGANSWKTGWLAFTYAFVSFITPYIFVFQPEILLMGTATQTVTTTIIMTIGIFFLAGGVAGYMFVAIDQIWERALLFAIAILIIVPESVTSVIGMSIGAVVAFMLFMKSRKDNQKIVV
ncbi:TRAP transporter permease [Marinisporobacter balticus]|uniref:TRAP transporter 4TM/12TM fusion protein n=1 Tax=Marinisporobacter balticus TaxID=2018667 RepID=A0A4R2KSW6_9FIRM|nr:TRAP transporter fused permease subunit [Marinisporobacter balticus]TCO76874.1 TRAP transporter 4TM/12TM fusion protein [Marinisporobacter balticus]